MDGDVRVPRRGATLLRAAASGGPLLLCALALSVAVLAYVAGAVLPSAVPAVLAWLPTPVAALALAVQCRRTARAEELAAATRRFWRHLGVGAGLAAAAGVARIADVLREVSGSGSHTWAVAFGHAGAVAAVVWALLRLPRDRQGAGAALRLLLDAGTLLLSGAVFLWHFQARAYLDGNPLSARTALTLVLVGLTALGAVYATARLAVSTDPYLDDVTRRLLAGAMAVAAALPTAQPYLSAVRPRLGVAAVALPAVLLLAAAAAERQRRAGHVRRRGAVQPRRRPYSLLPYVAVGAVDLLLLVQVWQGGRDARAVVAAAVLLTALVVVRQVTAFRDNGRLLDRLDHGATHDALTQLPNRVLFGERLHRALTAPGDRPVAVALIDLDDFKEVNDTLGHEVGDLLLIAVAQRLDGCVRVDDTVARLGGDEFVVVLDGADPAAADLAAERMVAALREPVVADGHELPVRASIGIADGRTGDEPGVLLRRADIAMYAAKNVAGTAYLHYADGLAAAGGVDHAHLGTELRTAIGAGELFLLYQPIVDLGDGRLVGAEVLVRWAHPRHGTLAPDAFIPLAERTGLVVPLGRWVLREAVRQLAAWTRAYGSAAPAVLNVNVSARDLAQPDFAARVAAVLAEYDVPADRITLEVTETSALEPGQPVVTMRLLRALGVRVSLDDFGTGHSPLSLLHDVPVDEIKLDRSFTQADADGRPPVSAAVVQLARALGLHAVAEGVETAEQAEALRALGYPAAQGYWFARPLPPEQLAALLVRGGAPQPAARRS